MAKTKVTKKTKAAASAVDETPKANAEGARSRKTKVRGKKYAVARAKTDPTKSYEPTEALKLACETSISSFPGRIELHIVLARGTVNKLIDLPYSPGATKKVEIASNETVEKLKAGKVDFDVLVASPSMMGKLVPFARVLGPRGLMPNPKNGTISENPEEAAKKFGGNTLNVKSEAKAPLVHTVFGRTNQPQEELLANLNAVLTAIGQKTINRAYLAPTMGPSIKLFITN